MLDRHGLVLSEIATGQPLQIEICYAATTQVTPICEVRIRRADGLPCYDFSTGASHVTFTILPGPGRMSIDVDRIDLNSGTYLIDAAFYSADWADCYHHRTSMSPFVVRGHGSEDTVLNAPHRWTVVHGLEESGPATAPEALFER